jgi:hypothetical protein
VARGAAETPWDAAARVGPEGERASKTAGGIGEREGRGAPLSLGGAVLGGVLGARAERVGRAGAVETRESRTAVA